MVKATVTFFTAGIGSKRVVVLTERDLFGHTDRARTDRPLTERTEAIVVPRTRLTFAVLDQAPFAETVDAGTRKTGVATLGNAVLVLGTRLGLLGRLAASHRIVLFSTRAAGAAESFAGVVGRALRINLAGALTIGEEMKTRPSRVVAHIARMRIAVVTGTPRMPTKPAAAVSRIAVG